MILTEFNETTENLRRQCLSLKEEVFPGNYYRLEQDYTLIGYQENNIIGFIELGNSNFGRALSFDIETTEKMFEKIESGLYIGKIAVDEKYRNLGFGSNLLFNGISFRRIIIERPKSSSVVCLVDENNPSDDFWLKNGFNNIGEYEAHNLSQRVYQRDF